ncbi:hypothetical protein PGH12_01660 [Chryseobacterium wangxinyae]|uniref:hypothetical protein n=1 Tax=Chryseobacterium sp. CY350 TaxID=2997336 RepID=UPI00226ECC97|nr:hypothetical protein [Chryseobacterium sp. CY350]MCY0979235.1 hypothetical protein [Chryseobacterium sp. CY350]WBZ95867.1 hypothetical protein PGH12_01660 [Chryseobacterium sp. CY350]
MKKLIFIFIMSGAMVACQNDEKVSSQQEESMMHQEMVQKVNNSKTKEMTDFDAALKKIGKDGPEKYIDPNGQLNQAGFNLLAPLAKKIIISSGKTEADLRSLSDGDLINDAFRVYQQNMSKYRSSLSLTK